jgi:hypothetical protein
MLTHGNEHLDPPRYPVLINPLEQGMKQQFEAVVKKLVIDVTKQLVKEVKEK